MAKYLIVHCIDTTLANGMPGLSRQGQTLTYRDDVANADLTYDFNNHADDHEIIYVSYTPGADAPQDTRLASLDAGTHFSAIVAFGSHSDVDATTSLPKKWNGLDNPEDLTFIKKLLDKKITADTIVLDGCLTLSYLNYFHPLLSKNGVFVASVPTLTGATMSGRSLPLIFNNQTNFHAAFQATDNLVTQVIPVSPYGVFFKSDDKLYRFNDERLLEYATLLQAGANDFRDILVHLVRMTGRDPVHNMVQKMAKGIEASTKALKNPKLPSIAPWKHSIREQVVFDDPDEFRGAIQRATATW